MKLKKGKTEHALPSDGEEVYWCGIKHPREPQVVIQLRRVCSRDINHMIDHHGEDGPPLGIPDYYAVGAGEQEGVLLVYPPPSGDMEIVGEYVVRKKL